MVAVDDSQQLHQATKKGLDFLVSIQGQDGSWRGDYGGPMFLLPMYVAACHIVEQPIVEPRKTGIITTFKNAQNDDGSVGLHVEDEGSMFASVLSYVALRLLGVPPGDPVAASMGEWIRRNGTALGCASWGKLVLALLNLYPYEGLQPILPELWLMPYAVPFHPGRMWCHSRQVYLPMAYLYGMKATIEASDLIHALRGEIYDRPYDEIDFSRHRDDVAPSDDRFPVTPWLRLGQQLMAGYEKVHPTGFRQRALESLFDHIRYEDEATHYIDIGPVNSVLNTIVHHFDDPRGEALRKSLAALDGYLWDSPDGLKLNGYNSTALWDTAFAVQAIMATPFAAEHHGSLTRAHGYIRDNQVVDDPPDRVRYYRHASRGGWPFSDRLHGWPITDCTAEGFKSAVALEAIGIEPLDESLLQDTVRLLLSFQNRDGGWATYEKQRAGAWLEWLNPSQIFGGIMADYSYVECTSACIQALVQAKRRFPMRFDRSIDRAVRRGVKFIKSRQRPAGGWEGSWAVCFTYGTWFGVSGLVAAGVPASDPCLRRASGFLIQRQNRDGGWGEHHSSCTRGRYVRDEQSRVVQTSWALLALGRAGLGGIESARRAGRFLIRSQQADGDWPAEPLVGVFNKTALINYDNYRRYFPIWALAELGRAEQP